MPHRRRFVLAVLLLATVGCLDLLTGTAVRARSALVRIALADVTTPLDGERVDVSISGPGIQTPIFGSFRFVNDTARAELEVPLGKDRLVFVAVFDSANTLIASGEATVEIGSGISVSVPVPVVPSDGSQPIIVIVGGVRLNVSPGTLALSPGDTATLTATITDNNGAPISGAAPTFASSNPAIATVSPTGRVTGKLQGVTAVTVTALGVAARVPVSVASPTLRSP
jgi:hypothetical protein